MRKKKQKVKRQQFWERYRAEVNPSQANYISPLAQAAFESRLQYFNYTIHGFDLRFNPQESCRIYSITSECIDELKIVVQDTKIRMLRRNPAIRRFLLTPIEKHDLPSRLKNTLISYEIKNMQDLAQRWHRKLLHKRGFGNDSIQRLVSLFDKNGCFTLTL